MAKIDDIKRTWEQEANSLQIYIRRPQPTPEADDSLEFHAARLLLLLFYAGGPRKKRIDGRTKLAKMDFLVRYPAYLQKAARIKGHKAKIESIARPESKMIRFKYGPWDEKYYNVFAYLVAKGLVDIFPNRKNGDVFQLTEKGKVAAGELGGPEFDEVIQRCKLVFELFGDETGNSVKRFIYDHFPEIVGKPLGAEIEEDDE